MCATRPRATKRCPRLPGISAPLDRRCERRPGRRERPGAADPLARGGRHQSRRHLFHPPRRDPTFGRATRARRPRRRVVDPRENWGSRLHGLLRLEGRIVGIDPRARPRARAARGAGERDLPRLGRHVDGAGGLRGIAAAMGTTVRRRRAKAMESVPLGRMSKPNEVAALVAWVVSPSAGDDRPIDRSQQRGLPRIVASPPRSIPRAAACWSRCSRRSSSSRRP